MALIKCPECGKDISEKATSCPNCGYPINLEEKSNIEDNKTKSPSNSKIVKKSVCNKKILFIIDMLIAVVLLVAIISCVNKLEERNAEKEHQAQLEAEIKTYQEMLETSKENITPYIEYVGKYYEAGSKINLPPNLYNNIENVEFLGMRGEIEYGTTATSKEQDFYVRYCSWKSFDGFSEEEFQKIAKDLEAYFGCPPEVDSRDYTKGHTYRYFWFDSETELFVSYGHNLFMYLPDGSIEIMWATEYCEGSDFYGL